MSDQIRNRFGSMRWLARVACEFLGGTGGALLQPVLGRKSGLQDGIAINTLSCKEGALVTAGVADEERTMGTRSVVAGPGAKGK